MQRTRQGRKITTLNTADAKKREKKSLLVLLYGLRTRLLSGSSFSSSRNNIRHSICQACSSFHFPWPTETCYCHKRLTTNWMFFPPYVDHVIDNSTSSLPIGGIIPTIVVDMVSACCGYCRSHGESYVDYSSYTSKETLQNKKTYNDMVENISQEIDFSFPVFGFEGKLK